jgi:predicted O-linked N-acetylglucosamine transferase (SPINDLY family)
MIGAHFLYRRASQLHAANRLPEALENYNAALAIEPDFPEALYNRGIALWALGRPEEALESTGQAVKARPHYFEALYNRGVMLQQLGRHAEALQNYEAAHGLRPRDVAVLNNRAGALQSLGRFLEALASCDAALKIAPHRAGLHYNRGTILDFLDRHEEAAACFEQVLALDPGHRDAFGYLAGCLLQLCDWARTEGLKEELEERVRLNRSLVAPLTFLGFSGDPAAQRRCAENYLRDRIPRQPAPLWSGTPYHHDKIRVAYVSADFHQHATAQLIAGLFERHDRDKFEIIAASLGEDDASPMRARLVRGFDRFHDMRGKSDLDIARFLRSMEVDIAVDLKGHTQGSRPEIFSHRFAPVQVSYLGYPGTSGAEFMDYILADAVVAPQEQQAFFSEKIVYLPATYQPNDPARPIADIAPTRGDFGLPAEGFVFCCFNNSWKITPALFDAWMRLLTSVKGSVLWLLQTGEGAQKNLTAAAAARGVDPARLVFAPRLPPDRHLARHRLADLFLDTLPCNAHTTASDALWSGLPIVTCLGASFAGRVAASLLCAAGLPELVAPDLAEYEKLALDLARNPARLADLKNRLAAGRNSCPLFDVDSLCRSIEQAFERMHSLARSGKNAESFSLGYAPKADGRDTAG